MTKPNDNRAPYAPFAQPAEWTLPNTPADYLLRISNLQQQRDELQRQVKRLLASNRSSLAALREVAALFDEMSTPGKDGNSIFDDVAIDILPEMINSTCDAVTAAIAAAEGSVASATVLSSKLEGRAE